MNRYILGIDQSTSGTKALIFDKNAEILGRADCSHEQKISSEGWVSHNPMEIYRNVLRAVRDVIAETKIDSSDIVAVALSNQRETAMVWERESALPVQDAIVWQCGRAKTLCEALQSEAEFIKSHTGLPLSPYFSAAKIAWILEQNPHLNRKKLCAGTMDSWLVFKLTQGKCFKTDFSNASRTQLLDLEKLAWNTEICAFFNIDKEMLPEICDSNAHFGDTDFEGILPHTVPIFSVFGDSHGALYGQNCLQAGMIKATYGTGSSVMMNIGEKAVFSKNGLVTSLAWSIDGKVNYVLEGNINYTGSVTKWLVDDLQLIASAKEAGQLAKTANPNDQTYLLPAFTGLGAPYWKSEVKAMLYGMDRHTGKAEIVKAAEECIAYQIADIVESMREETHLEIKELCVDGGPTRDDFLMQFQSDLLDVSLSVPNSEELSVIGAVYAAGTKAELYEKNIFSKMSRSHYHSSMSQTVRENKYSGWRKAISLLLQS